MPAARVTIVVRNDLSEITPLLTRIEQFGEAAGLADDQTNAMMLVIDEAVTNTISYGFPAGGDHTISIALSRDDQTCTVVVEDDGVAFNPLEAPEANLDASLEERGIGGLGIHLMRSYMDTLDYRRDQGKNILTLGKNLSASE
jgi:anti-sigma regulatory factor (Ser/Thr protein kinase)